MKKKTRGKRGRPPAPKPTSGPPDTTKLNAAVQDKIVKGIILGLPDRALGPFAGITRQTYYNYLTRGSAAEVLESEGKKIPEDELIYLKLYHAVDSAIAECMARSLLGIDRAGQGVRNDDGTFALAPSWQAHAWKLERKWPDDFGRKERIEHSGDKKNPVQIENITEAEIDKRLAKLLEIIGSSKAEKAK